MASMHNAKSRCESCVLRGKRSCQHQDHEAAKALAKFLRSSIKKFEGIHNGHVDVQKDRIDLRTTRLTQEIQRFARVHKGPKFLNQAGTFYDTLVHHLIKLAVVDRDQQP